MINMFVGFRFLNTIEEKDIIIANLWLSNLWLLFTGTVFIRYKVVGFKSVYTVFLFVCFVCFFQFILSGLVRISSY